MNINVSENIINIHMETRMAADSALYFKQQGAYGTVARCFHPQTQEVVAVKAIKDPSSNVRNEVEMLRALSRLQPDKYNIVRFISYFRDRHARCLAFETLDKSLDNFIKQRSPLNLKEIRPIAQQLLVALDGLKTAGIIHADLKPDNVMLVNHNLKPYKVKLIDFGLTGYSAVMDCNTIGQPYMFMAPEATLGYKLSEAIDMWSLGCTLGECFTGAPLFSDDSRYNNLRSIVRLLGLPSRKVLQEGEMSEQFFIWTDNFRRFKSPEEYLLSEGYMDPVVDSPLEKCYTLESVFQGSCTDEGNPEYRDRMAFADLIKRLLDMDPETRITPREALHHHFITMEHLVGDNSEYSEAARSIMSEALKDSTKVSDLCPPTSPKLQVPQAVPKVENPASSVALGEKEGKHIKNVPPPVVVGDTNGTQILLCIGGDEQDSQMTIHEPYISIREFQMNSTDNAQPEKSEPSIPGKVLIDPEPICDEPLYTENTSGTQIAELLDRDILDPLMDTVKNFQPEICDVPFCVDETSGIRMSDCVEMGILDLQMNIQPEQFHNSLINVGIVNQLNYIEETSGTQIPESLDRTLHITHNEISEDTDPAGTSSSKSSVRKRCKRVASCGHRVGQSVLSYMVSSSPNITGAVVLPAFLWRRVESVVNKNSRPTPSRRQQPLHQPVTSRNLF